MRIVGTTVLLTGATGGIGRVLARRFTDGGADVVATGRDVDALREIARDTGATTMTVDLSDPDAPAALARRCGHAGIVVANAALPASGDLLEYSVEQIDRALTVNLRSAVVLSRLMAPGMVEAGRGHIALVGSMSGKAALPDSSLYTATKFGLRGFAHGLRQDLRPAGVGVSLVQPGLVREAGMFSRTGAPVPAGTRTVSPEQVADAVVRAIEGDRAEVDVAPLGLRLHCALAVQFPALAERLRRRRSDDGAGRRIVDAQRALR